MSKIYKICSASAWREAERLGVFAGSADDLRDGFIHLCTQAQLAETARRHFSGQQGLFLIVVDGDLLGEALRLERSRRGELYPHLHAPLDLAAVTDVLEFAMASDGTPIMPELEP